MSEPFKCEVCEEIGRRRRFTLVPDEWFYAEVSDTETGAVSVIGVCSEKCKNGFFRKGPGRLTTTKKEPTDERQEQVVKSDHYGEMRGWFLVLPKDTDKSLRLSGGELDMKVDYDDVDQERVLESAKRLVDHLNKTGFKS